LIDELVAVLLDVDGTLLTEDGAIPGAGAIVDRLRHRDFPFRIVTNITRRSRASVVERLRVHGVHVAPDEVFTAVYAGATWMQRRSIRRVAAFVSEDALADLAAFDLVGGTARPGGAPAGPPDAVLIGDVGERWTHALLNEAFRYVMDGAELVALQSGRYWLGPTGLEVDAGAYVAALEYASGRTATVCGKPNDEFFGAVVGSLEDAAGAGALDRSRVAMVGDDLAADIGGAQGAGLKGWLVRTGKYRDDVLAGSQITPDRVLNSVADLC
jgi:HAD superfamily hydrolase (TIGR01458 family)